MRPVCPSCGFIFYLNPIVAAGTLVEHEGRVALIRRGVEPGRNRWGLPAGYVEADESAEEAAVRETWEETHLRVGIDGLLDAYSFGQDQDRGVLLIYAAHLVSGELEAGDDALDARWFEPGELPDIAFRTHREVLHKWLQARSVIYRRATPAQADANAVASLAQVYALEQGCDYAGVLGDPDQELFVALDGGQVVGFSVLDVDPQTGTAEIGQIFVHPRYRRWGIGTHLIQTCLAFTPIRGVRAVQVEVPVSNPGWTVYLKAGFRISGFTNDYYGSRSTMPEAALILTYTT